jgi:hypothetical protein
MSVFGKLKLAVDIVTLGQATLFEQQVKIADKVVNVTIDVQNQIVRVGEELFLQAPGEIFFPGLGPLAGLLKNEIEDELLLLSPLGLVPSIETSLGLDAVGTAILVGELLGVVQHRKMFPEELAVARYVFGDSLGRLGGIRVTNLIGADGNPFAAPMHGGGATVNLGGHYVHTSHVHNMPLLLHELTHIWQIDNGFLEHIAICEGLLSGAADTLGEDVYSFEPGEQWPDYGVEEQASIVEAWGRGAIARRNKAFAFDPSLGGPFARDVFRLNTSVFRYINGNVRLGKTKAQTSPGDSIRELLADGGHHTVREMHPPSPPVTWNPRVGT